MEMLNEAIMNANSKLYSKLVPMEGPASSKAGELLRAVNKIGCRFWNDGDMIGFQYGNETCNPAARFILEEFGNTPMSLLVSSLWKIAGRSSYENVLCSLVEETLRYIEDNPELVTEENEWDYLDFAEDSDREWEEEFYEEDEYSASHPWAIYEP